MLSLSDLEFLPTATNVERGSAQSAVRAAADAHTALMALTSCEANDVVANSQLPEEPTSSWAKAAESIWSDDIEDKHEACLARKITLGRCSHLDSKRVWNAGNPTCRAARRS